VPALKHPEQLTARLHSFWLRTSLQRCIYCGA
jgi:hypothetical protein